MIRRALTTNTNVLVGLAARLNGIGQELLDRRITLVEQVRNDPRVTVQTQGQLGQVVGADGEAVEELQELIRQNGVGR